jgi:pilus assembly protein CpaC
MLKVRISEMQRQVAKQFGVNLATAAIQNGVPILLSSNNQFGLLGQALNDLSGGQIGQVCADGSNPLSGTCVVRPNNLEGTFKALEQVGLLHTLAEPNLTAVSGETAKFLAGGEFPVPSGRDSSGNVSVEFKPFGVGLSFTPVVLSGGRISLQISTEVSELTNTGSFTLAGGSSVVNGVTTTTAGVTIPALAVRRAETTVELPSGGSFAIAGLMQHTTKQELDAFPGVKDLPILGALFRSRDFQNNETELVVVVSAYLVNPVAEAKLATPSDGFVEPADPETILLGRLNAVYKRNANPVTPTAAQPVGFVVR